MPVGVLTKPRPTHGQPAPGVPAVIVTPQPPCPPPDAQVPADMHVTTVTSVHRSGEADRVDLGAIERRRWAETSGSVEKRLQMHVPPSTEITLPVM